MSIDKLRTTATATTKTMPTTLATLFAPFLHFTGNVRRRRVIKNEKENKAEQSRAGQGGLCAACRTQRKHTQNGETLRILRTANKLRARTQQQENALRLSVGRRRRSHHSRKPPHSLLFSTFPDHPRRLATLMKPVVLLFAPFYSRGERFGSGRRRVGANFLRSALVSAAADRSLVALRLTASHSSSSSGSTSNSTGSGAKNKSGRARERKEWDRAIERERERASELINHAQLNVVRCGRQ